MQIDVQRTEYDSGKLERADLKASPFEQFAGWFEQACQSKVIEPNAMSLATAGADGRPSVRTVLLIRVDVFISETTSELLATVPLKL